MRTVCRNGEREDRRRTQSFREDKQILKAKSKPTVMVYLPKLNCMCPNNYYCKFTNNQKINNFAQ